MKHNKWIAIIFSGINIVLITVFGVLLFRVDRIGPEFKFKVSELIYTENTTEQDLLNNIVATDNKDGDVTGRIVIEKIIQNKGERFIVVFYAVSDVAGNVTKTSRVFPAAYVSEEMEQDQVSLDTDDAVAENVKAIEEASVKEAEEVDEEAEVNEIEQAEISEAEEAAEREEAPVTEAAASVNDRDNMQNDNVETVTVGEAPVMTLKASEVTTKVGIAPAWVEVIGSLSDDTDDYETLFSNLSVSKYDIHKAGDYKVSLTVTDSNKNTSKPVTLTIHVK